ncbi:hypothetical protein P689_122270 [Candidatus Riesia pediculischaeffi PTSU]|uniref:Uncharacterized protein n=1 Tax=Candidatus Riesia pediculischaeffi PTSU TaxID=1401651 RepID=A0A0C1V7K0_9ENTR|nr:hypothetical protein P689_122270 [Candidatus Riesia pediculischaeffi PTSU]
MKKFLFLRKHKDHHRKMIFHYLVGKYFMKKIMGAYPEMYILTRIRKDLK